MNLSCCSRSEVRVLTFEEAAELSTFGSKVVHPAAVLPAWQAGVPMSVRNSMAPEDPGSVRVPLSCSRVVRSSSNATPSAVECCHVAVFVGTRIVPKLSDSDTRERRVAAISSKNNITMIVSHLQLSLFALVFQACGFKLADSDLNSPESKPEPKEASK